MEPIKKNRLKFESVEPPTSPSIPRYETDEYVALPKERNSPNPLPLTLFFVLLVLLIAGASYLYIFNKDKYGNALNNKDSFFSSNTL